MKFLRMAMSGAALLLLGGVAVAFEETKVGGPPAASAPESPRSAPKVTAPENDKRPGARLSLDSGDEASARSGKGTEVRIPGLGRLGVIPKLDFGLELLHGAANENERLRDDQKKSGDDDVTIRGSIRHRF